MAIPTPAANQLAALMEQFAEAGRRCRLHDGPDEIHDLRVAIRRLDQGLEVCARWLPAKRTTELRSRIDRLLRAAGEVRDRDIVLHLIERLNLEVTTEAAAGIRARRDIESAKLRRKLERVRLPAELIPNPDARLDGGWQELATTLLPEVAATFIDAGDELANHPESRRRLHKFRIRAKRLRYTLECFAGLYAAALAKRTERVKAVQTVLGHLQDTVASRRLLRKAGATKGVLQLLRAEGVRRLEEFQELWPKLFPEGSAALWARYLRRTVANV